MEHSLSARYYFVRPVEFDELKVIEYVRSRGVPEKGLSIFLDSDCLFLEMRSDIDVPVLSIVEGLSYLLGQQPTKRWMRYEKKV